MLNSEQEFDSNFNDFYLFIRTSIIHYYGFCLNRIDQPFYSRFLDKGYDCSEYLEFLEYMYKVFVNSKGNL